MAAPTSPIRFPERIMSNTHKSFFVHETPPINVFVPSCKGVRVEDFNASFPYAPGNYTHQTLIDTMAGKLAFRAEVFQGLYGLGNNLQGMFTAFILAFLSGRQMIVSPGGRNLLPLLTLKEGYVSGIGWLEPGTPPGLYKVPGIRNPTLAIPSPVSIVMFNDFHDTFWFSEPQRRQCVYDAMGCWSLWSCRVQFYQYLFISGSKDLERAIARFTVFEYPPKRDFSSRRMMQEQPPQGTGSEGTDLQLQGVPDGTVVQCVVMNGTVTNCKVPNNTAQAPQSGAEGAGSSEKQNSTSQPLTPPDAEANDTSSSSSSGSSDDVGYEGCPLCAKFDVAIHLRTKTKCVEDKNTEGMKCDDQGLQGAIEAMERDDGVWPAPAYWLRRWACLGHHLSELLRMKLRRQLELGKKFKGLMRDPRDTEEVESLLKSRFHLQGRRPKDNPHFNGTFKPVKSSSEAAKYSDRIEKLGLWTVEDSEFLANKVWEEVLEEYDNMTANGTLKASEIPLEDLEDLNILLATDASFMRPLYVELLKPFGLVATSKAPVVHLLFNKGDPVTRLGTVGEFYLMSRASILLGHPAHRSYALVASLAGNSTMAWGQDQEHCGYWVENIAPAPK